MAGAAATLWMGDLEHYMDEVFVSRAFLHLGENIQNVKLIRKKVTGLPAGYGFIDFLDPESAHKAMLRLNGKPIPGTKPTIRFKLNMASFGKEHLKEPEYSLFVGDLSEDVDDYTLYKEFAKRYRSCRAAKVVHEFSGLSKGYGFVRFTDEADQKKAVFEMAHASGIGQKLIRVSLALPKREIVTPSPGYSSYYNPYHQYQTHYSVWSNENQAASYSSQYTQQNEEEQYEESPEDDEALVDPELEVDVAELNAEFMEHSEEIYFALEESRWQPLDTITSQITMEVR